MADESSGTVSTSIAGGAIGFGVAAVLAPRIITGLYGLPNTGPFRFLLRIWGTRTATLGALLIAEADDARRRRLMTAATAMNAVDAIVALSAGPEVKKRSKFLAALTSGGFAAAGVAFLAGAID